MEENIVFSITISNKLKQELSERFNVKFADLDICTFPDGEYFVRPLVSVRGKKAFVFHALSHPVNENIMKLLVTIDSLKRSSAKEIHLIISYLAYARQDRKTEARSAITSRLISDLICKAGATKITLIDLHSEQIEGFFEIPLDHLYTVPIFAEYLIKNYGKNIEDFIVVSPDFGATKKSRVLSRLLGIPIVIMEKIRSQEGKIEEQHVYGDVNFKKCIILDDIIGTGGTIINASKTLKKLGAESVIVCATHGLFSGFALNKLKEAYTEGHISEVLVTDSVPLDKTLPFIKVVSLSKLISSVLQVYMRGSGSISKIYDEMRNNLFNLRGI
ncbi:hypothetical protein PVNG_02373 [Plasmodium vivax North Korean]|uniref:ribose-phosphate diphosphokinase n=1 Tax=Plasmodium vivax North Korean TaxID=1035514 RepID=A0A0J9TKI1_PLAVI|nr:hypothetical protein PVNG_02373 [Plasmodium vivax North Korean]